MVSAAYILGALDAMVKSGEMSPDYARGVASVIEKQATLLPWADSAHTNLNEEIDKFYAGKPTGYKATAADKAGIIDRSRHWYDDWQWARKGYNYLGNRARLLASKIDPTNPRTKADYDQEWENWKQNDRQRYIQREFDNKRNQRMWDTIAGAENHNNNMANAYYTSTQRYMTPGQRRAAGVPGSPRNIGFTPMVNSMVSGGLYQLDHDYDKPKTPARTYGQGVPAHIYGANRTMFYDRSRIR